VKEPRANGGHQPARGQSRRRLRPRNERGSRPTADFVKITLHDIGIWSPYVGDQPLHVSIHFNDWGNFPNPNGYMDSKKVHAYFEGEFVKRNLSRRAVAAEVGPYQSCSCSIEDQTRTLLLASLAQVVPLYLCIEIMTLWRGLDRLEAV
jgi:hypothetical protein